MKDIAREAGVSRGAVSFALNDRPGVSEETRRRVKQVAAEMGWSPSAAALALSSRQARAVGLVIASSNDSFASESFFLRLISGIERSLQPLNFSLVLQVVPDLEAEAAACRTWWAEGRVDGVLLVNPQLDDPRAALMAELGMPGVVVGGSWPGERLAGLPTDDRGAMRQVVEHLAAQGHRRVAYVLGRGGLDHTRVRQEVFEQVAHAAGLHPEVSAFTDVTEDSGRRETARLLQLDARPTAIVYDNEILALGGMAGVQAAGLACPDDVAIVSCEDSPICRVVQPGITSLVRDPALLGQMATDRLLELLAGQPPTEGPAPTPELAVRASTLSP
ncbi:LacI family DNA-binding transcriptional regulator [Luteococcus peritonei]